MVCDLREGLHAAIGAAAEAISQVVAQAGRERHPERYREPLDRFDQARALLDLVGWRETGAPTEVRVDLREHRRALLDALGVEMIVAEDDQREAVTLDAERAARGEPPQREATARRVRALRELAASVEAQASRRPRSR
jgi:hypothetical protein